jgi:polyhydroxyalkanoate synthesis regulator phasin
MESVDGSSSNKNFFKYVFNFDNDSKSEMLNIIQFILIAIIPIVILNKAMSKYVPEADDNKSSLEITAEIIVQAIVMFMGLLLIHRIITFIPTYSGTKYHEFSVITVILPVLMITISLQTKLGEKVNILVDRLVDLWEGKMGGEQNKKKKSKKSNQQQQQQQQSNNSHSMMPQTPNQQAMNQSLYNDGTSIHSLPSYDSGSSSSTNMPNYDNMYRKDNTPLVNAASPGQGQSQEGFSSEPMAANSLLGSGAFGSW